MGMRGAALPRAATRPAGSHSLASRPRQAHQRPRRGGGRERSAAHPGAEIEAVLHRFPNVVLWINGHTHRNTVRRGPTHGPVGRLLGGDDRFADRVAQPGAPRRDRRQRQRHPLRLCTMVDHAAPADPSDADGLCGSPRSTANWPLTTHTEAWSRASRVSLSTATSSWSSPRRLIFKWEPHRC